MDETEKLSLTDSILDQIPAEERSAPAIEEGVTDTTPVSETSEALTPPEPAPVSSSLREALQSQYGLELSHLPDDQSALAFLAQQTLEAQQNRWYTEVGRQMAPHADRFRTMLEQPPAPTQPTRQPWEPPEFDQRWAQMVDRDPATGMWKSKPGYDPSLGNKVQAYVDFQDKVTSDPSLRAQHIQHEARKIAREELDSRFSEYTTRQRVDQLLNSNSSWLYARDAAGNPTVAPDGRYVPSQHGARYFSHVKTLHAAGVTNPDQLDSLAKSMLRGDVAGVQGKAVANAAKAASPQARQAQSRVTANPLQDLPLDQQQTPGATDSSSRGLNLHDMLKRSMKAEGITDDAIYNDFLQPA